MPHAFVWLGLLTAAAAVATWLARRYALRGNLLKNPGFEESAEKILPWHIIVHADPESYSYSLVPEGGLVRAQDGQDRASLSGVQWQALQAALEQPAPFGPVMRAVVDVNAWLNPQLRALLHYHCGVHTLRTRQLMKDLQAL